MGPLAHGRRSRPHATRAALLLLVVLILPLAQAGGTLQAGPATVVVDDERGTSCSTPVLGLCQVEVRHADDPGDAEVDAHQQIHYVGVAVEPPADLPLALLPDGGLVFRPSDVAFYVPYREAVLKVVTLVPSPGPSSPVRWQWHRDASVELFYPEFGGLTKGRNRYGGLEAGEMPGFDNGTLTLRNLEVPLNSTDGYVAGTMRCSERFCPDPVGATPLVLKATPNAHATFAVVEAGVATDASDLGPRGNGTRAPSATGVALHTTSAPAPRLSRDEPQETPRLDWIPAKERPEPPQAARGTSGAPREAGAEAASSALGGAETPPWTIIASGAAAAAIAALLGIGLYSRIRNERDALRSEPRLRIHQLVHDTPGISSTELAAAMGLSRNATMHHVRVLQRARLVRIERAQGRTLTFPRSEPATAASHVLARLLEDDPVVRVLRDEPGLTRAQIHARLADVPQRTRNHRLKRLFDLDLVRVEGEIGAYRHYLRHGPFA